MVRVSKLIEERLTEQSITALRYLVGEELHIRTPHIMACADGSFFCERMIFVKSLDAAYAQCVLLEIQELESPTTSDHYYRYSVQERREVWPDLSAQSSWTYREGAARSRIVAIDVFSYDSLPDQVKAWPELDELPESLSFDYELSLKMDDAGLVSVKPMHNGSLLFVTLKQSHELPEYRSKLGVNLNLRMTIN